jgi:hypothetical protein
MALVEPAVEIKTPPIEATSAGRKAALLIVV